MTRTSPWSVKSSALNLVVLMSFTFVSTYSVQAADLTWDPGNTGNGTTIDPGNGTWDLIVGNIVWNNDGTNVPWSQTNATTPTNVAIFGGVDGAYSVTLGSAIAAQRVQFNNSGYTLGATTPQTLFLNLDSGSFGTVQPGLPTGQALYVAAGKTFSAGNNVTILANGNNAGVSTTAFLAGAGSVLNVNSGSTLTRTNGTTGVLRFSGTGTVNVAGTVSFNNPGQAGGLMLSSYSTDNVTVNVNSGGVLSSDGNGNNQFTFGAIVVNNGAGATTGGTGILNINSGGSVIASFASAANGGIILSRNANGVATINLDGGSLTTPRVVHLAGASTFNFNGGTDLQLYEQHQLHDGPHPRQRPQWRGTDQHQRVRRHGRPGS
jgi:hypothetical protein